MNAMNMLPDWDAEPGAEFVPVPTLAAAEIADAVLFLASDESRYITGVTLRSAVTRQARPTP